MEKNSNDPESTSISVRTDPTNHAWENSWTYIKTMANVIREPILILDQDLKVMMANDSFYRAFQVESEDTEEKVVYELGNGQWDIQALRKLLEEILPENTFFKGFEVINEFPTIGRKVMILNARVIGIPNDGIFPSIILLAIEDVTDMMTVAESLASNAKHVELSLTKRANKLDTQMKKMEKEISALKKVRR